MAGIIDDTIKLRDKLTPNRRIAVLSNATIFHRKPMFDVLVKIKDNIQKLDSAFEELNLIADRLRKIGCDVQVSGSSGLKKIRFQVSANSDDLKPEFCNIYKLVLHHSELLPIQRIPATKPFSSNRSSLSSQP